MHRKKQLKELHEYLGHVTAAANGLVLPDGTKVRDSTAISLRSRATRKKGKADRIPANKVVRKAPYKPSGRPWRVASRWACVAKTASRSKAAAMRVDNARLKRS